MKINRKVIEETMTYYWFLKDERNDITFDNMMKAFRTLNVTGLLSDEDYQFITETHELLADKF